MATLTATVTAGESVKLCPASKVEPQIRYGEAPPASAVVDTQVANASGVVSFTVASRIEFYAYRPNGRYVKLMSSTTRGWPS